MVKALTPLINPKPLPILHPSTFVPSKKGFPVVRRLSFQNEEPQKKSRAPLKSAREKKITRKRFLSARKARERESATLDEKSSSSGIAEPDVCAIKIEGKNRGGKNGRHL